MARRSGIRASDADRDGVVDRLRQAAAEGRLAAHELEQRVTSALKATTYGELDATVSDLPAPEGERGSRRRSASGRAVATVQAHPALILVAIPVALMVVAMMVLMTVLWAAMMVLMVVLGGHNRRMMMYRRGPWMYARRHDHRLGAGGSLPWV